MIPYKERADKRVVCTTPKMKKSVPKKKNLRPIVSPKRQEAWNILRKMG